MSTLIPRGNVARMYMAQVVFNPASISAATTAEQDITVSGVQVGDMAILSKPTLTAGVTIGNVRVKAANTISVQFVNATASPVDPASETYTFLIIRPESNSLGTVVVG